MSSLVFLKSDGMDLVFYFINKSYLTFGTLLGFGSIQLGFGLLVKVEVLVLFKLKRVYRSVLLYPNKELINKNIKCSSIEERWPYCSFSHFLFSSSLLLFAVTLFTVTVYIAPEHHKFLSFSSPLQSQIKPSLLSIKNSKS